MDRTLATLCPGPDSAHIPTQKSYKRTGLRKYFLFTAASDGCVQCVRRLLEEGVPPSALSESCKYSALDFAAWEITQARKKGCAAPGCEAVVEFLQGAPFSQQYNTTPPPNPPAAPSAPSQWAPSAGDEMDWTEECTLCHQRKVCATTPPTDLDARLRHAVWEECIQCTQSLLALRADPMASGTGIWGESAMSLATDRHQRALRFVSMLSEVSAPPPPQC